VKNIILIFVSISIFAFESSAQCVRLSKCDIGESGCSAYFVSEPEIADVSAMEDGSEVYTTTATCESHTFGILIVKFAEPISDDVETKEDVLETYTDIVKSLLEVTASAGYGKGHTHDKNPNAVGIIDFCEDSFGNTIAMKSWADTKYAAMLYVISPGDKELNFNVQQLFLNGFRFPYDE